MKSYFSATFELLPIMLQSSHVVHSAVESVERRLGFQLPASVREWYSYEQAIEVLASYSNRDRPLPLEEFAVLEWRCHRLLPFKRENQGVCTWSILLDGSDDPPVYVDVDTKGAEWDIQAPAFSDYVYSCVWDYVSVFNGSAMVAAQNGALSVEALGRLRELFKEHSPTFGWPGTSQHRFIGEHQAILIWTGKDHADWFVRAEDAQSLEKALRAIWDLDDVGRFFYDHDEVGKAVLDRIRTEPPSCVAKSI